MEDEYIIQKVHSLVKKLRNLISSAKLRSFTNMKPVLCKVKVFHAISIACIRPFQTAVEMQSMLRSGISYP